MSIVLCPECGKEVSSQALACPACGYRSPGQGSPEQKKQATDAQLEETESRDRYALKKYPMTFILSLALSAVGFSGYIISYFEAKSPPNPPPFTTLFRLNGLSAIYINMQIGGFVMGCIGIAWRVRLEIKVRKELPLRKAPLRPEGPQT